MSSRSTAEIETLIQSGVEAVEREEYLAALNTLIDVYSTAQDVQHARGLSYLGLCLALVEKKYEAALDLCRRALEMQPAEAAHHHNMIRVLLAAGDRKKAVETCEEALRVVGGDERIVAMRQELGIRARPAVPFLSRDNAINQALGRARHAKKVQNDIPSSVAPTAADED